ncbi:porin, partial [Mesorhizobium sp. M1050]
DVNASDAIQLWVMGGYGSDDNLSDPTWAIPAGGRGFFKQWGGNWAIWGGGTYKFNEKTSFNTQISYDEDQNLGVAANIAYDVVPGLTVTAEVDYVNEGDSNWTGIPAGEDSAIGGILRFQRSF